jgi:hypothetical protein
MANGVKTGGRTKGVPNKSTAEVREAIAAFASANVDQMGDWLNAIDSPEKKLDLFLRAIEYHIPKLARTEISGDPDQPVIQRIELEIVKAKAANP